MDSQVKQVLVVASRTATSDRLMREIEARGDWRLSVHAADSRRHRS
jgi:hypothetical protein